jgi:hypothetical protein
MAGVTGSASAEPPPDPHAGWTRSGDILQWVIPAAGLGLSYLIGTRSDQTTPTDTFGLLATADEDGNPPGWNWPGPRLDGSPHRDFLISFVRMEVLTYALKYGINEQRPHHGGGQSFPSGHSAAAFMGAEFIRKEYGWGWGTPALLAASWVGYTRVESYNHYWHDVVAGALIGVLSNYDLDEIHFGRSSLRITPALMGRNGFAGDIVETDSAASGLLVEDARRVPGLAFEWQFGGGH